MVNIQDRAAGRGRILAISSAPGLSVQVRIALDRRHAHPTLLSFSLVGPDAQAIAEGAETVLPNSDAHMSRHFFRVSIQVLRTHPMWGPLLELGQAVCLRWKFELRDVEGRVLGRGTFRDEYSDPE
ncbi:hypothetical protein [Polyangium aurulentum]|uniref:hypothetical protein n=1 Tax=Polyangium aurulentum TaxID=2567896 RepID=UPI0010AE9B1B|nr:hypothetical protein [Polyangium aurulentum]UQA59231.1 hypothetical protein E8A73_001550 [Polyangium aurulentum]